MAEQRYRVLERLEAGGMAEVFRGAAISVQGFKKSVAIKRVLPHLVQNKKFLKMFLDEARLGAKLSHGNIVTVFDIGAADSTYFIVMEFVDGTNLKRMMEALRKKGETVPVNEAVYICMEACRGLSYAHELVDDDGSPLHLVHRDVSPPNIMLTKRGEVKLTDFGLAKATTQLEKTDPGVVKGKFSYLSPEAAMGQEVDARADVFALGVVLWEMLAGRRLFIGENDYQTVKLVQHAQVPSLGALNAEVDSELEELVNKTLARNPDERFQSARDMGNALADYLFGHQRRVTSYDIANLVNHTITSPTSVVAPVRISSRIDKLIQEELQNFTSLDSMSDPLAHADSPEPRLASNGARPLDAQIFGARSKRGAEEQNPEGQVDTRNWGENLLEDDPAKTLPPSRKIPSLRPAEGLAGWLEEDTDKHARPGSLASGGPMSHMPVSVSNPPLPRPPKLPQMAHATAKGTATSGKMWWLFVLSVMATAGLAAAAWQLKWF
ncbi:MAG: serine/threonine protein kinase [Myxococcales bacterium]|nr:serine/threonine protein kinase [Myxococcales bacterium]MCB9707511.1 serine/threonine protein kinase [Myxococcales bacterium]